MEILYKGKFNRNIYYDLTDPIKDTCIVQLVYPAKPKNYIHTYSGNTFSEDDNIVIYRNKNGEIIVYAIQTDK